MDARDILWRLLIAALLGVAGQLIRVIVGLKKESDQASAANQTLKDRFNALELWTSLGIALVVGILAGILSAVATMSLDTKAQLGFLAAGYSGTDFIEGAMKKALPGQ